MELNVKTLEILGGSQFSGWRGRVAEILSAHDWNRATLEQLRYFCTHQSSLGWASISDIIVAVTTAGRYNATQWLEVVAFPLSEETPSELATQLRYQYCLGAILGSFESAVWLDTYCSGNTRFDDRLLEMIKPIILNQRPSLNSLFTIGELRGDEAFTGRLSGAVKAFVRPKDTHVQLGERLAKVLNLIDELAEARVGEEIIPLSIGQCLADQLAYAYFGSISLAGRLQAVASILDVIENN